MKSHIKTLLSSGALVLLGHAHVTAQAASPELLTQAKKEGRVAWYTTVSIPESKQFMDMFEKQYPFIKVDLLRSGSGPRVELSAFKTFNVERLAGIAIARKDRACAEARCAERSCGRTIGDRVATGRV